MVTGCVGSRMENLIVFERNVVADTLTSVDFGGRGLGLGLLQTETT
jgi:hypothetical protein